MVLCKRYTVWLIFKNRCKSTTVQFFSSTTFSDRLPLINGLPFRNSKKYDSTSLYLSHMMVDRSSRCYSRGSDFFCDKIIFVTKYRIQSHVKRRFLLYMLLFWKKTKMWNSFINREFTTNVIFKLRISQNRKWADKNSSNQFLLTKNCVKLLIYVYK